MKVEEKYSLLPLLLMYYSVLLHAGGFVDASFLSFFFYNRRCFGQLKCTSSNLIGRKVNESSNGPKGSRTDDNLVEFFFSFTFTSQHFQFCLIYMGKFL